MPSPAISFADGIATFDRVLQQLINVREELVDNHALELSKAGLVVPSIPRRVYSPKFESTSVSEALAEETSKKKPSERKPCSSPLQVKANVEEVASLASTKTCENPVARMSKESRLARLDGAVRRRTTSSILAESQELPSGFKTSTHSNRPSTAVYAIPSVEFPPGDLKDSGYEKAEFNRFASSDEAEKPSSVSKGVSSLPTVSQSMSYQDALSENPHHDHFSLNSSTSPKKSFKGKKYVMVDTWAQNSNLAKMRMSDEVYVDVGGTLSSIKVTLRKGAKVAQEQTKHSWFVIHPFSKLRMTWVLISLSLLAYDCIMIPVTACFDVAAEGFINIVAWTSCFFWMIDLVLGFFTGVFINDAISTNLREIAGYYLKTWFMLDLIIVVADCFMLFLSGVSESSPLGLLRNFRWFRFLRLLRFLRLVRLLKLKPFLLEIMVLWMSGMSLAIIVLRWTLYIILSMHFAACAWYLLGVELDNGWVHVNGLVSYSNSWKYLLSLRWFMGRLHGVASDLKLDTSIELVVENIVIVACIMFVAMYFGSMFHVIMENRTSNLSRLKHCAVGFVQRHRIQRVTYHKVLHFLFSVSHDDTPCEIIRSEAHLFKVLPKLLQEQMIYEARGKLAVESCSFLAELHGKLPRVVGKLCYEAMTDVLSEEDELVFAKDDVAHHMFFVREGSYTYTQRATERNRLCRKRSFSEHIPLTLSEGDLVSEAALWTYWTHYGDMVANENAICVSLNCQQFADVVVLSSSAIIFAVKYARYFVRELNRNPHDDTTIFPATFEEIDADMLNSDEHHFIFISHFKQEAGTEATLMRSMLEDMIEEFAHDASDLEIPIFIDSEGLTDLSRVRHHVGSSMALVVLLTPGLLTRPWCLLEIVTASRQDVEIVPVDIQRPGVEYAYPDDEFYEKLRNGDVVDKAGLDLLEKHGVSSVDVEVAVKAMFQKISLPFSPHKSQNIRIAEVTDIVNRADQSDKSQCLFMSNYRSKSKRSLNVKKKTSAPR